MKLDTTVSIRMNSKAWKKAEKVADKIDSTRSEMVQNFIEGLSDNNN